MNRIVYKVIEAKKLDEETISVVVQINIEKMLNGYGGGRITVADHVDRIDARIAELVRWKVFGQIGDVSEHEFNIDQDLSVLHELIGGGIAPEGIAPEGIAPEGIAPEGIAPEEADIHPIQEGAVVEPSHAE